MAKLGSIFVLLISISISTSTTPLASQTTSGSSSAGVQLIQDLDCTTCHMLVGKGVGTASDLGKTVARNYSPSFVAGRIWSHAPAIWAQMSAQNNPLPRLTEAQSAGLFAYFASSRYFEELGNAKRGKAVFQARKCTECHSTTASNGGNGKAVPAWSSLENPLALACALLNRPEAMNKAIANSRSSVPRLSSQEVSDILVYLRHQPDTRGREIHFSLSASLEDGRALFEKEGCAKCHVGKLSLDRQKSRLTLSGFIAAMWNHDARVKEVKTNITDENLTAITGYLWAIGLFDERGNPTRGQRLFIKMRCNSCHDGSGKEAPALNGIQWSAQYPFCVEITTAIWNRGPAMLKRMQSKGISWPNFTGSQMADLEAFLRQGHQAKIGF